MNKSIKSQVIALYVRAGAGHCSVELDGYRLYNCSDTGHSFSSNLNLWVREGNLDLEVIWSPAERLLSVSAPAVELELRSGAEVILLLTQEATPEPNLPCEVRRRPDQTVETVVVRHIVRFSMPPCLNWLTIPQPWGGVFSPGDFDLVLGLHKEIETALISGDRDRLVELASTRISYVSGRLQLDPLELQKVFFGSIDAITQGSSVIEKCIEPKLQLRLVQIKKNILYKIEWASGLSAIHTLPDETGMQQGFQIYVGRTSKGLAWII